MSTILSLRLLNLSLKNKNLLSKSIMTSCSTKAKKFFDGLKDNPYFDKYAGAIAKLQLTNPEEFLSRIEKTEKKKHHLSKPTTTTTTTPKESSSSGQFNNREAAINPKPSLSSSDLLKQQQQNKVSSSSSSSAGLADVMKLELLEDKGKQEITDIWLNYHKQKDCICGVMEPETFDLMFKRGKQYPTFLLPLPRENGYEFILSQFSSSSSAAAAGYKIHMTPLLWYQTHQENAPECLTIIHYTDLRDSKGLVLMKGEFDCKSINVQEAQCLANELQLYYAKDNNPDRLRLLETFTKRPDEFKHMDLIKHLETISLLTDKNNDNTFISKKQQQQQQSPPPPPPPPSTTTTTTKQ